MGSVQPSPHSRLWRQYGVIDDVTARAVNIAGFQFITLIRHLTHNRASGCNINNLTLTTSVAKSATWGKPMNPRGINRGAVADSVIKVIRVLSGRRFRGASVVRGLRFAYPRLSPFGFRLRGHAFQATRRRGVVVRRGRISLEAPIELQVGGRVAAVGTAMLGGFVVHLVEVELQFEVLQNPIFSRDAVDGLGG